ncbi:MAG: hypothetical protein RMM28_10420 [Thermoleophilia bacterium]|nr:hypothetical protein [Gaiellaceae bacterium]MDW8339540.1 hypothetical protein [Thermoleophilia bacterium]
MPPIRYFLIVYDRRRGALLEDPPREFTDEDAAMAAYGNTERAHQDDRNVEVVLVGADSLDTVRRTHSNYFGSELSELLSGV